MGFIHRADFLDKYIIIKIIEFVKEEEREHQIIEKRNIGLYIGKPQRLTFKLGLNGIKDMLLYKM